MTTLGATEEPHLAFIGSPELAEPPEGKVVLALGALDLDGGERFDIFFLVIHDSDLVFRALALHGHLVVGLDLPDIPALAALELASRGYQQTFTFRTKHRIPV